VWHFVALFYSSGVLKLHHSSATYGFLTPLFVIVLSASIGMDKFEAIIIPGILMIIGAMFIILKEPKLKPSKIETKKTLFCEL